MFRKFVVVPAVVVSLVCSGYASNVSAAVITTQEALSAEQRAAAERDVREKLARDDVRQAMLRLGVGPAEADARIAALSDAELRQVQGRLDTLPAGGDSALAVIGIVFIVLLILELTGVIDIFKRA